MKRARQGEGKPLNLVAMFLMPRHIRELIMFAGAKIQNRSEKSANNNKEYGQKALTSAYILLFHGHIIFPTCKN